MLPVTLAVVAAVLLAAFQITFGPGVFEYQQLKPYEGQFLKKPYPILVTNHRAIPLVAPGKHGAESLFAGMSRQSISFMATSIHRDGEEMLEVQPGSIHPITGFSPVPPVELVGTHSLVGEIVDSKCFLGVMNPSSGRVHRECAVRCISGGVPPIFVVRDRTDRNQFLYITNATREILEDVAKPVRIDGQLFRQSNLLFFQISGISRRY